ncbi:MAG: FIST signal transduction protein [Bradymonadia bacterium]
MMLITTAASAHVGTADAVQALIDALNAKLAESGEDGCVTDEDGLRGLITIAYNAEHDATLISAGLREAFPDFAILGASSCLGAMTEAGVWGDAGAGGLAALLMCDPDGDFGAGISPVGDDPQEAGRQALRAALEAAERPGELPELVWCSPSPGHEEAVIEGLQSVLGPGTPIIGGSAADNEVAGGWSHFAGTQVEQEGVAVAVLFPSGTVGFAFRSGYEPTEKTGTVTRVEGRSIVEIDGEPAAEVYDRWTDGLLAGSGALEGGNVLGVTTMSPLGRTVGQVGGFDEYLLVHPERVGPEGVLATFAEIAQGEALTLMTGTRDSLATRAGRVAADAMELGRQDKDDIAGALVIFCAGCMLTIREEMPRVVKSLNGTLEGRPFLGAFTFGEQGCLSTGANRHGNLMISVVTFSR